MSDLRKFTDFELYYLKIKVTIGMFAELKDNIDESKVMEALKSASQYLNFIILKLSYSKEEPFQWIETQALPVVEKLEGDNTIDELSHLLCNEPLQASQCSRIYIQKNKIGMIVFHAAIDGKIFTNLFLYLMSYLSNNTINKDKYRLISNNSKISIKELSFDTKEVIPPTNPSDILRTINVPCTQKKGPSKQCFITIRDSKYDKLESFLNKLQEKTKSKVGITSTILTLINIAMNKYNKNEVYKSCVIDCIINLDKYLPSNNTSNDCYLCAISSTPLLIESDKDILESTVRNTDTLYNTINSKLPLYYYTKMNENCVTIDCTDVEAGFDKKELDVVLEYSSFGNYHLPSNVKENGLRISQSCHGMVNLLSVASLQDRERRFINFTFTAYAGAKIEGFIDIFYNLFDEL